MSHRWARPLETWATVRTYSPFAMSLTIQYIALIALFSSPLSIRMICFRRRRPALHSRLPPYILDLVLLTSATVTLLALSPSRPRFLLSPRLPFSRFQPRPPLRPRQHVRMVELPKPSRTYITLLPVLVKGRKLEAPFSLHLPSRAFSRSRLTV
jgi:hypothetical protein